MTELLNGGGTGITGDENSLLFEWTYLRLKHRLSWGVLRCLPWLFPVPLLWKLSIPFGCGMMNTIWVCGIVVCLLFFLLMAIKRWEPTFWSYKCSHVWVSVPGIKLITSFLSQYNPNWALKYDLSGKGKYFTVHISHVITKSNNNQNILIWAPLSTSRIDIFQCIQKLCLTTIHVPQIDTL